jgi:hypothetical protein
MKEIKYDVNIKGSTALLINRYIEGTVQEIKVRKGEAKQVKAEDKLYTDAKGLIYIPANYIRGALIEAGKNVQVQGKKRATYSKLMGSTITIMPEGIQIKPQTWEPYTITAVNPMTRGRMVVTRPKFTQWELSFSIIATDDIPEDKLAIILEEAGNFVGIGDWRPQKKECLESLLLQNSRR